MVAASQGHAEVMRALLAAPNVDLDKRATDGWIEGKTALGLAMHEDKHEIAAMLRAAGEEQQQEQEGEQGAAAASAREAPAGTGRRIYDAAKKGDMAVLRPLVQEWTGNEYVLNWANRELAGWTPLIIGSREGKVEAVRLLLATPGEPRSCCAFLPSLVTALINPVFFPLH